LRPRPVTAKPPADPPAPQDSRDRLAQLPPKRRPPRDQRELATTLRQPIATLLDQNRTRPCESGVAARKPGRTRGKGQAAPPGRNASGGPGPSPGCDRPERVQKGAPSIPLTAGRPRLRRRAAARRPQMRPRSSPEGPGRSARPGGTSRRAQSRKPAMQRKRTHSCRHRRRGGVRARAVRSPANALHARALWSSPARRRGPTHKFVLPASKDFPAWHAPLSASQWQNTTRYAIT